MTQFTNRRPTSRPSQPTPAMLDDPPIADLKDWWYRVKRFQTQEFFKLENTNQILGVQIRDEVIARADGDAILATEIASIVVVIGTKSTISVQSTAPTSPALNDLWIDTSDNNKAKYWDGSAWQYKQDGVLFAAISTESTVRASADATLASQITSVIAAYTSADTILQGNITTEATTRASADSALATSITTVSSTLTTETSDRIAADNTLQTNINTVSASVVTEASTRASADSALATSISTVSAAVATAQSTADSKIKTFYQSATPTATTIGDLWIDTGNGYAVKRWDGLSWVDGTVAAGAISVVAASVTTEASARASADTALATSISTVSASVTTETTNRTNADNTLQTNINTVSASVTTEASARATADGFLSGKYTLTVAAGDVVTGMNITSSSGSGTNISDVTFVAANFKIYNGSTGKVMFNVSGSDVTLANTLVVSTSGKVYIGTGTFNATNTSFYVDSAGQFSLKDKLSWDGTTLTINGGGTFSGALSAATGSFSGTITASAGTIGGFSIGSDYIRDAANSMGLASTVTGGDDVRFWAGAAFASRSSAPFRVTEAGALVASSATITGVITSTSGTIGGFTIGATSLSAGSGGSYISFLSTVASFGMQLGDDSTSKALFYRDGVTHSWTGTVNADTGMEFSGGTRNGYLRLRNTGTLNVELKGQDGSGVFSGAITAGGKIRSNTRFNTNGADGADGTIVLVGGGAATNITVQGGIITAWS